MTNIKHKKGLFWFLTQFVVEGIFYIVLLNGVLNVKQTMPRFDLAIHWLRVAYSD